MSNANTTAKVTKITPVRIVDRIEPCMPFWCDALGYRKAAELAHDGRLGFVMLEAPDDGGEFMLQTRACLADDIAPAGALEPHTVLYVEVASLAAAREATRQAKVLVAERTTSYGMRESVVVDPAGTVVILAEKA